MIKKAHFQEGEEAKIKRIPDVFAKITSIHPYLLPILHPKYKIEMYTKEQANGENYELFIRRAKVSQKALEKITS